MNNKDEKTFADLFSSSEHEESNTQSFVSIFKIDEQKSDSSELESENTKNNAITFDNIYDNIVEEKKEVEPTFDLFSEAAKEASVVVEEQNLNVSEPEVSLNSLFGADSKEKEQVSLEKESIKEVNQVPEIESNPFISPSFEENAEENNRESVVSAEEKNPLFTDVFSTPEVSESSENENSVEEKDVLGNPFFSNNTDSVADVSFEKKENSVKKEEIENPFFQPANNPVDEQIEASNPFFGELNSSEGNAENKVELTNHHDEHAESAEETASNPFFDLKSEGDDVSVDNHQTVEENASKDDGVLENKVADNPFFAVGDTGNLNVQETSSSSEIKDNEVINLQKEKESVKEEEVVKSSSPFFQEESSSGRENPFFQNQLNLVENKLPDTPTGTIDMNKSKHYNVKVVKKKESLLKFILGVFSYAIFIFLLLVGITLLIYVLDIKIRASKGDYSSPTFNAYVVLTGSMLPEIEVYDVVVTKKVDAADLQEKDIITFASDDSRFKGTIITHRIIKKNPPSDSSSGYTFQTKGDNNNVADSALVPEANIYGKVILKIPKLGYLQEFLASDGGWIIVILIPCLVVISYDIVKLLKGLKRKKYKNIKVQK